jgi:hypothetical protein
LLNAADIAASQAMLERSIFSTLACLPTGYFLGILTGRPCR